MSEVEFSEVEIYFGPEEQRLDVFSRYTFELSMLEVGCAWTLSLWYSDVARASWQLLTDRERGLKCGQLVTAAIDGEAVLSGLVEAREVGDPDGDDRGELAFVISGRDVLGAAASWHADPTLSLPGRTLEDALGDLYRGVGIVAEVSESIDPEARVGNLRTPRRGTRSRRTSRRQLTRMKHPNVGEPVQAVVERIVRGLGYRVWTAADVGRTPVIVDRPRTGGEVHFNLTREVINGRVTERSNLLKGREATNIRNVPSVVTVFADAPRGDAEAAKIAREVTNGFLLTDAALARVDIDAPPRPMYVQSESARDEASAHNEASRICAEANERFRVYHATVLGHRQSGRLWAPNNRVAVRDDFLGIDETWLTTKVTFEGGRDWQKTRLELVPDGALSEIPHPATGR